MEIKLWQAIIIGVFYYLSINGTPWLTLLGSTTMVKPLIGGTLVGLVLGDPVKGCIIGATINLPYLGFISAGGTLPVDPGLAGILGTALAMASGASPEVAVTLAVPLGLLGTIIWVAHMTIDIVFVHMADKAAEEGDLDRINFLHVVPPQIALFIISVIPVTLAVYFGSGVVKNIIDALGGKPLHVLTVIGGILPALGIAMNLKTLVNRKGALLFFLLGFLLPTYFELEMIVVAMFAIIIGYFYTELHFGREGDLSNGR